ncbi:MAG: hypothetical protein QF512_00275 [Alphaproteobacteria bacterium]|jgi:hypothetical protein|nr:hypothetical protein [Alphaproteobacteria bacterium]
MVYGLTPTIADEYNDADPPNRKRIYDNVAKAQDWWLGAADEQIADQAYATNFAKAARWARDDGNDYSNFAKVMTTAGKFEVQPDEFDRYLNGAPEEHEALIQDINKRIMPWAHTGMDEDFSGMPDQAPVQDADGGDDTDWGVPETIYNKGNYATGANTDNSPNYDSGDDTYFTDPDNEEATRTEYGGEDVEFSGPQNDTANYTPDPDGTGAAASKIEQTPANQSLDNAATEASETPESPGAHAEFRGMMGAYARGDTGRALNKAGNLLRIGIETARPHVQEFLERLETEPEKVEQELSTPRSPSATTNPKQRPADIGIGGCSRPARGAFGASAPRSYPRSWSISRTARTRHTNWR